MADSPAAAAKLERGDVITAYNGKPVTDPGQLRMLVADTAPGTSVTLTVIRDKQSRDITLTIGELPKDLAKSGRTEPGTGKGEHALSGVTVEDLPADQRRGRRETGVVVTDVDGDSPAERAGLRQGDIIREINRKPIRSVSDFEKVLSELKPKTRLLLLVSRGNATIYLSVTPD
jgi:serine protease Do